MDALKKNRHRIISLNLAKKIILSLLIILIFDFFLFPAPALANEFEKITNINTENIITENQDIILINSEKNQEIINNLPVNNDRQIQNMGNFTITAYNSDLAQCDASPCITANGFNVCKHGEEDTIASNFLPFGAKVRIPELSGDKIFIVRDRMSKRYSNRLDIWMINKFDAIKFGVKIAKVEILE